ncbi:MAG TPA: hypothetical protein VNL77_17175, partial [Roseiflexaceae bacterium]|nr:hypothetical protein [Roseiflexaceae bacterium]
AEVLDSRVDEPRLQEALAEVRRRGGVERAHAEARACAERAAAQLTGLPDGPALEALRALAAAAAGS